MSSFEAPYIRVFFQGREITVGITRFKYSYSEEDDDVCTMSISTDDRLAPDRLEFQEKVTWDISWGYIGGATARRKIYLQDIEWDYSATEITAEIKATELGATLKANSSKKGHKRTNLPVMAATIAQKNGLNLILDVNKKPTLPGSSTGVQTTIPMVFNESVMKLSKMEQSTFFKIQKEIDRIPGNELEKLNSHYGPLADSTLKTKFILPQAIDETYVDAMRSYRYHGYIPQANKSDMQVLKETAKAEPGGQTVVETRDDNIIVKRRSFSQNPYKAYEYGGSAGDIISFKPASSNRNKSGTSMGLGYSGWNKDEKNFFKGEVGAESSGDVVLNKLVELRDNLSKLTAEQKQSAAVDDNVTFNKHVGQSNRRGVQPGESTSVFKIFRVPVTNQMKLDAVNKTISNLKNVHDPTAQGAGDAASKAQNLNDRGELQRNISSAQIWGDPGVECGMVITITGVSKKYSGNYYITKADHSIDTNGGYLIDLELTRQGHNLKYLDTQVTPQQLKRGQNAKKGTNRPTKPKTEKKQEANKPLNPMDNHDAIKIAKLKQEAFQKQLRISNNEY